MKTHDRISSQKRGKVLKSDAAWCSGSHDLVHNQRFRACYPKLEMGQLTGKERHASRLAEGRRST